MIKRNSIILITIILINAFSGFAQKDTDKIVIGEYRIINSSILNEEQKIMVTLPDEYENTKIDYPVFHLLYGNHVKSYYMEAITAIYNLSQSGFIPPFIIVGIEVIDHGFRDLLLD
ncbi:alpha/beta hydrolase-fold protein [Bacteroidota bacterium]